MIDQPEHREKEALGRWGFNGCPHSLALCLNTRMLLNMLLPIVAIVHISGGGLDSSVDGRCVRIAE
jgi:hypothetical protein